MTQIKLTILANLIKALLPHVLSDDENEMEALESLNLPELNAYDLFENACCIHYHLSYGTTLPETLTVEDYAKTL